MNNATLTVRAFLRKYKVEWSEKYNTRIAVPCLDKKIKDFSCAHEAYAKTQRLIKTDFDSGIVQDVWFQCIFERKEIQLTLF